ncbi:MAG: Ig-like domain-containing protein [Clostridia bacterium]|nr:Ig-like domain-containing protein [Clostridia bacterium]
MKKSVVVLILIIYIASVAFVGFLGMKMMTYNETVMVERIECINEDMVEVEEVKLGANGLPEIGTDGQEVKIKYKKVTLRFTEGLKYQLETRAYPETANQAVVYEYTSSIATVDENGLVSFTKRGTIDITIVSATFRSIVTKVQIVVRRG